MSRRTRALLVKLHVEIFRRKPIKISTNISLHSAVIFVRRQARSNGRAPLFHAILLPYDIKQRRDIAGTAKPFRLPMAYTCATIVLPLYETLIVCQILTREIVFQLRARERNIYPTACIQGQASIAGMSRIEKKKWKKEKISPRFSRVCFSRFDTAAVRRSFFDPTGPFRSSAKHFSSLPSSPSPR